MQNGICVWGSHKEETLYPWLDHDQYNKILVSKLKKAFKYPFNVVPQLKFLALSVIMSTNSFDLACVTMIFVNLVLSSIAFKSNFQSNSLSWLIFAEYGSMMKDCFFVELYELLPVITGLLDTAIFTLDRCSSRRKYLLVRLVWTRSLISFTLISPHSNDLSEFNNIENLELDSLLVLIYLTTNLICFVFIFLACSCVLSRLSR